MSMNRRAFLAAFPLLAATPRWGRAGPSASIQTVLGPIDRATLGVTLIHEHVLVDFIGADKIRPDRYRTDEVFNLALPHLKALKRKGCDTLVECTPNYLGRDARLLRRLARAGGLHILTNTGYYGAGKGKYLPRHAYDETAADLAARWTREFREGIDGTDIRPGFLKIGVNAGILSEIDRKLIAAAAQCHRQTGLMIHVHTGDGGAAMDIIDTLQRGRVSPAAYVWVHAQNEKNRDLHRKAAQSGAWVSFDGVSEKRLEDHAEAIVEMIGYGFLDRLLVSQDAGWYHVGEPGGGTYRGYTFLFDEFLPALRRKGLSASHTKALLVTNPARALTRGVRKFA